MAIKHGGNCQFAVFVNSQWDMATPSLGHYKGVPMTLEFFLHQKDVIPSFLPHLWKYAPSFHVDIPVSIEIEEINQVCYSWYVSCI